METIGMLSSEFGSVYSPDGREHALTGLTPLQSLTLPGLFADPSPSPSGDCSQYSVGSLDYQKCMARTDPAATATVDPTTGKQTSGISLSDIFSPNVGAAGGVIVARIALVILGILLIVIAVYRLTSSN